MPRMPSFLRMIGFFVGVVLLMRLLRQVPGIGGLFQGFFAFWIVAILLSWRRPSTLPFAASRRR